jgi:hypothetical protein
LHARTHPHTHTHTRARALCPTGNLRLMESFFYDPSANTTAINKLINKKSVPEFETYMHYVQVSSDTLGPCAV